LHPSQRNAKSNNPREHFCYEDDISIKKKQTLKKYIRFELLALKAVLEKKYI